MTDKRASLGGLPAELFDDVCSHLTQRQLTLLARVSKSVNRKIQDPLYYHATVRGFTNLSLLSRTLADCSRRDGRGDLISKDVHDLHLILDPTKEAQGNRQTAVVLSRMVASVTRFCPKIRMHLVLENATCSGQPISSFNTESFPRVVNLILHTGPGERPERSEAQRTTTPLIFNSRVARAQLGAAMPGFGSTARDHRCSPNKEFWTGIFNGLSFPHLEEVEIHHVHTHYNGWGAPIIPPSELKGLQKITRLSVDSAPELNSTVLMSALQCAPNLKHLELKNIAELDYDVLAKLLGFALPNLQSFTLHVSPEHPAAVRARSMLHETDPLTTADIFAPPIHLCPIIRECGKNIPKLDLYLPYICRDLFLTPKERVLLNEAGVKCLVGERGGELEDGQSLDITSTVKIVGDYRKALEHAKTQAAVKERMANAKKEGKDMAITLAEYQEQQVKTGRKRAIQQGQWTRTVRASKRLCRSGEAWDELGVLAGLGEEGVTWVLGNERLKVAGIYAPGAIGNEKPYHELFPPVPVARPATVVRRRRVPDGYDHNDDQD